MIKPSGVSYDELTPELMIVCDLDGTSSRHAGQRPRALQRHRRARLRLPAHARGRRGGAHPLDLRRRLGGARRADPLRANGMADEFGGAIPVGPFALIGDDSIGRGIVETLSGHRSRAVLMRNHGVFTIGSAPRGRGQGRGDVEDVGAHRAHRPAGRAARPDPAEAIDRLYDRYQNVYGQAQTTVAASRRTTEES